MRLRTQNCGFSSYKVLLHVLPILATKQQQQQQQQQQNNCKNVTFEHYFTYNFKIFLKLDSIYSVCVGGYLEMPS